MCSSAAGDRAERGARTGSRPDLRALVERQHAAGRRVLVVPVFLSYGGIEAGLRKRLDGLPYRLAPQALAPDPRLVDWVLEQAR